MVSTLILHYGLCSIRVQVYGDLTRGYLAEVGQKLDIWILPNTQTAKCHLAVIPPYPDEITDPKYRAIAQAWAKARRELKRSDSDGLNAWRVLYQFGIPIDRGIFLFQDKDDVRGDFFCLNPTDTVRQPWSPSMWIIKAIEALGVHWHVTRGGVPLHASGVERDGSGYLFLGRSGAGKSTVAGLSEQAQAKIVHDDHVLLGLDSGHYLLAHPGSRITPPLRAVFLLKQSSRDHIVSLTPQATAAGLSKGLLEYAIGQDLYGSWVRQAFHNIAAIARTVPGYELHFRKSPDFWKVIDAELGNGR